MDEKLILADVLEEFAKKLRDDSCDLYAGDALELLSHVAHIKLNKQEVADRYGVSPKTIERREQSGTLPESYNQQISKKVWYLDELIKFEQENRVV